MSSFASGRRGRRNRRWRPTWQVRLEVEAHVAGTLHTSLCSLSQVTAPPPRVSRLMTEDPCSREEQLEHTWSEEDSRYFTVQYNSWNTHGELQVLYCSVQ